MRQFLRLVAAGIAAFFLSSAVQADGVKGWYSTDAEAWAACSKNGYPDYCQGGSNPDICGTSRSVYNCAYKAPGACDVYCYGPCLDGAAGAVCNGVTMPASVKSVSSGLKGQGFSLSAASAGQSAAEAAYNAAKSAGKSADDAIKAAQDAGYLAAAKYAQDSDKSSIMGKAILAGVLGVSTAVGGVAAVVAAGTLAPFLALGVATVAGGALAIDAYVDSTSAAMERTYASEPSLNVRLNSSSPSVVGAADVEVVGNKFTPAGGSFSGTGAAGSWSSGASGGWTYADTAKGVTAAIDAAGTSLTVSKTDSVTQKPIVTTANLTTATSAGADKPVVTVTTAAPVQTSSGVVEAGISRVYDLNGESQASPVVSVTNVLPSSSGSGGQKLTANDSILPASGGNGKSMGSQTTTTVSNLIGGSGSGGSGGSGSGGSGSGGSGGGTTVSSGCGSMTSPCDVYVIEPSAAFSGDFKAEKKTYEDEAGKIEKTIKDLATPTIDKTVFSVPWNLKLPGADCSSPEISSGGYVLKFPEWCEKAAMIRDLGSYVLYVITLMSLIQILTNSSKGT